MQIRFLVIEEQDIFLLGFPLKLTPTERKILIAIANSEVISSDELISLLPPNVSRGNITVHISSINKKALAIGGRKLILFGEKHYKINENM